MKNLLFTVKKLSFLNILFLLFFAHLGQAQNITVTGNGNNITNGSTKISNILGTNFGTDSNVMTYVVKNISTVGFQISIEKSGEKAWLYTTDFQNAYLEPGASKTLTVTFDKFTYSAGENPVTIAIKSYNAPVFSFNFNLGTVVPQYEINVQGNSINIPSNTNAISLANNTDFGKVGVFSDNTWSGTNNGTVTKQYVIQNEGGLDLDIYNVQINTQTYGANFTVSTEGGNQTIAPGAWTIVTVVYAPSLVGKHEAIVTINNRDSDEGSYTFAIHGEGVSVPVNDRAVGIENLDLCVGNGTNVIVTLSQNNHQYQLYLNDGTKIGTTVAGNGGTIKLPTGKLSTSTIFKVVDFTENLSMAITPRVHVYPAAVAGTILGGGNINAGDDRQSLTVSGSTGTILYWESKVEHSATWKKISNTWFKDIYNLGDVVFSAQYRAVLQSGPCSQVTSSPTSVNIISKLSGEVTGGQSICVGSDSGILSLSGNTATTIVRWESAVTPFTSWTTINNTKPTYAPGILTETTQFRAVVSTATGEISSTPTTVNLSSTTWNGKSWTNSLPTSGVTAIFSADYIALDDINACSLLVNNNAKVIIKEGINVTLNGAITVADGSSFTLENTANLLQNTNVENKGNIIVNRKSSELFRLDYTIWSSPVSGSQSLLDFSPLTSSNRFYTYNTLTNQYNAITNPATSKFDLAKGYLIRMPNNWSATNASSYNGQFIGKPNNGNIQIELSTEGNKYNAIGNPYPSAINIAKFIDANKDDIEGTLWFWRKTNDQKNPVSYSTVTKAGVASLGNFKKGTVSNTGEIAIGQGFVVKTNKETSSSTINFNNDMRSATSSNQFFRVAQNDKYWLELTDSNKESLGQNLIAYLPEATLGYDNGYDGIFINDTKTALVTMSDDKEVLIQARPKFEAGDVLPLIFKTDTEGDYTITLANVEGVFSKTQDIFLKDNVTGKTQNLKEGSYTFKADAGNYKDRFNITYQVALSVDANNFNENSVMIYKQNQDLIINAGSVIMKEVQIYDIQGRLLVNQKNINATQTNVTTIAKNQVLIIKIKTADSSSVTKKVIH